jgi:hypothetical protein
MDGGAFWGNEEKTKWLNIMKIRSVCNIWIFGLRIKLH